MYIIRNCKMSVKLLKIELLLTKEAQPKWPQSNFSAWNCRLLLNKLKKKTNFASPIQTLSTKKVILKAFSSFSDCDLVNNCYNPMEEPGHENSGNCHLAES